MLTATDPVCKMKVDEGKTKLRSEFGGSTYYFCGPKCKMAFDSAPEKFSTVRAV